MIKITGLSKAFHSNNGDMVAIGNAHLQVGQEEFVVLLGPSGSGKTTLLRCVAGLETADRGEIVIGDRVVFASQQRKNVSAENRGIGMVFQSYAIWPHLTVAQNVALPLTHGSMRVPRSEVKARVTEALRVVQLSGLEDRPAPHLSGGQQQRVALARALAVKPDALLMDEPLSNLDARLREEVRFEIRNIAKQIGVPVLYVTHDQTEAMDLADRIAVMQHGRILQVDSPEGVYDRPVDCAVASFLGPMNWLDGKPAGPGRIETAFGILNVSDCVNGPVRAAGVRIGIRPERIGLHGSSIEGPNVFRARCLGVSFLGDHEVYRMQLGSIVLTVKQLAQLSRDCVGKEIHLSLPEDAIRIFSEDQLVSDAGRRRT